MTRPLWTSKEAGEATNGHVEGHWQVDGISIDTRTIKPGDLFVALQDVRDGHDFVPMAYEKGAGACLVSRDVRDVPALQVEDTLTGLEQLGEAARARTDAFCCAVTGSVGKTSVKEMLARIFRGAGRAHWNDKSFNNQWGVPLTLARMPADTEYAVFEIGMNTPGEIAPRSLMVQPHAALITKIAPAHLEGMGSEDAVAIEKSAIFRGLLPAGAAILPAGDRFLDLMIKRMREYTQDAMLYTFGEPGSDAFVTGHSSDGVTSLFDLDISGEAVTVPVNAVGAHWGQNIAAALLMTKCAGIPVESAAASLAGYAPPEGRGNAEWLSLKSGGKALLVDDAYNANPESMRAAINGFAERPAAHRFIALGEMRELGANADAMHAELAGPVLAAKPDAVFLSGEGIRPLESALQDKITTYWAPKATDLQEMVNKLLTDGDALLIKGSNASGMRLLAEALRASSMSASDKTEVG